MCQLGTEHFLRAGNWPGHLLLFSYLHGFLFGKLLFIPTTTTNHSLVWAESVGCPEKAGVVFPNCHCSSLKRRISLGAPGNHPCMGW